MLSGYKTYAVAAGATVYAVLGLALGHLDYNAAVQIIIDSGLVAALRSGIAKA